MIIDKNNRWAFIHIPKNAGTSIRTSLERQNKKMGNMWHHQYWEYEKILDTIPYVFVVCRNPYSRLISLWKHMIFTMVESPNVNHRHIEIKNAHIYAALNGISGLLDLTKENGKFGQNRGSFYPADSQVSWIKKSDGSIPSNVHFFKLEDGLNLLSKEFKKRWNIQLNIGKHNSERRKLLSWQNYFAENTEIVAKIDDLYNADFEYFGYNKPQKK